MNMADYLPQNRNQALRKLFNLDLARAYGYHNGPVKLDASKHVKPVLTGPAIAADQQCSASATDQLKQGEHADALAQSLSGTANETASKASDVKSALKVWRSCMLPLGISDLPDTPAEVVEMPTTSQRTRYGLARDPGVAAGAQPYQGTTSSIEEVKEAVHDAECRNSSGFSAALYASEVAAQEKLIGAHRADLDRALSAALETNQIATGVVKRYGG